MRQTQQQYFFMGKALVRGRAIFRGYLSEELVSEDDNRRKSPVCVYCTNLKLSTRYIFYYCNSFSCTFFYILKASTN